MGDVRDPDAVARATAGADAVIHLAAAGNVVESVADPLANFDVNARGTLHRPAAAAEARRGPLRVRLDRRRADRRRAAARRRGERAAADQPVRGEQARRRGLLPRVPRLLRAADDRAALRQRLRPALGAQARGGHAVHRRRAARRSARRSSATAHASRDFLYVDDICAGILAALDAPDVGGAVHLASGRETTIAELARLVLAATGAQVPIEHRPARRGEVERNVASAGLAASALGWRPATELEAGLAATVDWFRTAC